MNVAELIHLTLNNDTTRQTIECYKNFVNIDKYEELIKNSEAAEWEVNTYEHYKNLYLPILDSIQSKLTLKEYQSFVDYRPYIDRLVYNLFKQLI